MGVWASAAALRASLLRKATMSGLPGAGTLGSGVERSMSCPFWDLPRLVLQQSDLLPIPLRWDCNFWGCLPLSTTDISAMIDDGASRPSMKALDKY
jgi:hypothetical protein